MKQGLSIILILLLVWGCKTKSETDNKIHEGIITYDVSYFTSEKIGEEVLSYDPIPGRQEGCVPVEDVGNVWSL